MSVNENEPVKCKDCGVWWRGLTHRCTTIIPRVDTLDDVKKIRIKDKEKIVKSGCPLCGAKGAHYCTGPKRDYTYTCNWCNKVVDYRYTHNCEQRKIQDHYE